MYLWSRGGIVFLEKVGFQNALLWLRYFESLGTPGLKFVQKLKEREAKDPNTSPCGSLPSI